MQKVIAKFKQHQDLSEPQPGANEDLGMIRSHTCKGYLDWVRLPEWAMDNDMFTRWCGSAAGSSHHHAFIIDLGESKPVDEVTIAWEFPHRRPGYTLYVSNDDSRFADGISVDELNDADGWTAAVSYRRVEIHNAFYWDRISVNVPGVTKWRYFKIRMDDTVDDQGG